MGFRSRPRLISLPLPSGPSWLGGRDAEQRVLGALPRLEVWPVVRREREKSATQELEEAGENARHSPILVPSWFCILRIRSDSA